MKGITPVISVVLLLIISVAVVGFAYIFIIGYIGEITGSAAIVNGLSVCDSNGNVSIYISNGGTGNLSIVPGVEFIIQRTQGPAGPAPTFSVSKPLLGPGELGSLTEISDVCGNGSRQTCHYSVIVSGQTYPTRADCF